MRAQLPDHFLNVAQAAAFMNISKSAVYKLVEHRLIPHIRLLDDRVLFHPAILEDWVLSFEVEAQTKSEIEEEVDNKMKQVFRRGMIIDA